MRDDAELLRQYVQAGSEDAFTELVQRHLPVVYASALRQAGGDQELAKDICQLVFIELGKNARSLLGHDLLIGWLFTATRFTATKMLRADRRRQVREAVAVSMRETSADVSVEHPLAPVLDEAMGELAAEDRNALLLRFFQDKPVKDVAVALRITEDAARMRVTRALDKLHGLLKERGVTLSVAALGTALTAEAVTAAPAGLAAAITTAALSASTITTTTAIGATKAFAMTTLQKAVTTATLAIVAGAGIHQAFRASQLRGQVQTLQQQQRLLAEQMQQLQRERDDATQRLSSRAVQKSSDADLLKLRAEVTALRQTARERATVESTAGTWATRIALLKQRLDQMPDKGIPEMAFLADKDWAAATRDADLSTEDGVRRALCALRSAAKDNFLNSMNDAIKKYAAAANGGDVPPDPGQLAQALNANPALLPSSLAQLKPYFTVPVDDAIFQRYQLLSPGKLHDNLSDTLVKEIAPPVDTEYDTHHEMGLYSGGVGAVNLIADAVAAAARDYAQANNGQMPTDPAQLARYLKQPLEATLVQKYLSTPSTAPAVSGK
jgi:RNA polymerase sigma factor (sigma-70 family)